MPGLPINFITFMEIHDHVCSLYKTLLDLNLVEIWRDSSVVESICYLSMEIICHSLVPR